jgi:hypothetical protein
VPVEDPLLRVLQADRLPGEVDDLVLMDVEIAAGPVVLPQVVLDVPEPPLEHLALARIGGIEVEDRLGAADLRAGHPELDLHGLREEDRLFACGAGPHAGAATRGAVAERIDHEPALGSGRLVVLPGHHLAGFAVEEIPVAQIAALIRHSQSPPPETSPPEPCPPKPSTTRTR